MTYGISTSSSVWSSAVTSKMTFFWCSGTGFLLMKATSSLILNHLLANCIVIGHKKSYFRPILSFSLLGG